MIDLSPFRARVRLLRAVLGGAIGLVAGGLAGGLLVAALAWHWVDWTLPFPLAVGLGVTALGGLVGAALGFFRSPSELDLARSVDTRAHTQDRLATAATVREGDLAEALARDANHTASELRAKQVYPLKAGPWHYGAMVSLALPVLAFFSASVPGLIDPARAEERKEGKVKSAEVERVAKEVEEAAKTDAAPQTKALSQALRKLSNDLKAERVDNKQQRERAADIRKLSNELVKSKAEDAQQHLTTARESLRKMDQAKAMDRELTDHQKQVLGMNDQERQEAARKVEAQMEANNRQIQALQNDLAHKPMSDAERKAAEQKLDQLIKEQKELQDQLKDLKMDQKLMDEMKKALDDPANADLKKLMDQMQQKLSQTQTKASQQKLTKEDIEKLKEQMKQMEEQMKQLLDAMKDPVKKQMLMQALEQAMKDMKDMQGAQAGLGLLPGLSGAPSPGPDNDIMLNDTGRIDKYDKPQQEVGKTVTKAVTGQRQDKGEETYMEVKGPAELTGKSSVPTQSIAPSASRKAEQAISRARSRPSTPTAYGLILSR